MAIQFSIRDALTWTAVYACLFAVAQGLRYTLIHWIAAIAVVSAFVILDVRSRQHERQVTPAFAQRFMLAGYYSTSLILALVACFALFCVLPAPPPKKTASFISTVVDFLTGKLYEDFGRGLAEGLSWFIGFVFRFVLLSITGFVSSLFAWRHFRSAKWLALMNLPGIVLLLWLLVAAILEREQP